MSSSSSSSLWGYHLLPDSYSLVDEEEPPPPPQQQQEPSSSVGDGGGAASSFSFLLSSCAAAKNLFGQVCEGLLPGIACARVPPPRLLVLVGQQRGGGPLLPPRGCARACLPCAATSCSIRSPCPSPSLYIYVPLLLLVDPVRSSLTVGTDNRHAPIPTTTPQTSYPSLYQNEDHLDTTTSRRHPLAGLLTGTPLVQFLRTFCNHTSSTSSSTSTSTSSTSTSLIGYQSLSYALEISTLFSFPHPLHPLPSPLLVRCVVCCRVQEQTCVFRPIHEDMLLQGQTQPKIDTQIPNEELEVFLRYRDMATPVCFYVQVAHTRSRSRANGNGQISPSGVVLRRGSPPHLVPPNSTLVQPLLSTQFSRPHTHKRRISKNSTFVNAKRHNVIQPPSFSSSPVRGVKAGGRRACSPMGVAGGSPVHTSLLPRTRRRLQQICSSSEEESNKEQEEEEKTTDTDESFEDPQEQDEEERPRKMVFVVAAVLDVERRGIQKKIDKMQRDLPPHPDYPEGYMWIPPPTTVEGGWNNVATVIVPSLDCKQLRYNSELLCALVANILIVKEALLDHLLQTNNHWPTDGSECRYECRIGSRNWRRSDGLFERCPICVIGSSNSIMVKTCRLLVKLGKCKYVRDPRKADHIIVGQPDCPDARALKGLLYRKEDEVFNTHGERFCTLVTPKYLFDWIHERSAPRPSKSRGHLFS